ncbi:flagellar basal-body rod protein FlgB [Kerstersia gyiorum]|nr:flagellar basal-body rod protein FlgB [Kerstersia gyiorum]MCP1636161.1 flagellar basal-body rod protein FlgB [Kerstersia gyiorum]MCP1671272.1 flagellar basal-body rod protein FlgB [Kerstersia gyiorum]MCP1679073.1 flagellar basal-body rod protein FlgB [Kerstersia gyiorum]MCP1681873.1 flagellar basal-body rod protein FlgB [Kerstersia gyiorum]
MSLVLGWQFPADCSFSVNENQGSYSSMLDRIDDHFSFHQKALALRAQRQEVLAANIANADTPGYQARDFDFSQALAAAEAGQQGGLPLAVTAPGHLRSAAPESGDASLLYRQPLQPSLDGNTVDMDVERVDFADNAMRYQASLTVLSSRIKGLLAAMQQ